MQYMRRLFLCGLGSMVVALSIVTNAASQEEEIELLIGEGKKEKAELEQLESELEGLEVEEGILGKVRLTRGEETPTRLIAQDRAVDPEHYVVGPGDVLQFYIWGEFDISYMLLVDPEGGILIPSVGAFDVGNKTLTQVRNMVFVSARENYPNVEISLNIESMRFFTVYITGAMTHEGNIAVHPNKRVADAIDLAGGFIDELRGNIGEEIAGGKSVTRVRRLDALPTARRGLLVTHMDATVDTVDHTMYLSTGDLRHNPYLRMGDRIHVNFRKDTVSLFGPWFHEGTQEYRPGDTIAEIIALAGGRRHNDPIHYVEIWRWSKGTEEYDVISVAGAINSTIPIRVDEFSGFALQSKDQVFVRTVHEWQFGPRVTVFGEVRYNGNYRIELGQTRLRDVIRRAGGFTEEAALDLATVSSTRSKPEPELERVQKLRRIGKLRPEDQSYLESKVVDKQGDIVVDFVRLFAENDESQNIVMSGGDALYIPRKRAIVKISGAFENPGLISYIPGKGVDYYAHLTGGFTHLADRDAARLIRAVGGLRLKFDHNLIVEESDEIWVPTRPHRDWWQIAETWTKVVTQILTAVVIVTAVTR